MFCILSCRNGGRCYRRCGAATVLTNVTSGALGSFETTPELNHSHQIYCLWIITPFQDVQTPYELAREKKTLPSISFTFEPDISVNCSTVSGFISLNIQLVQKSPAPSLTSVREIFKASLMFTQFFIAWVSNQVL